MPATVISPLAALLVHSQVAVDSQIGIQSGEDGLILNGVEIVATREAENINDHKKRKVMSIHGTPLFQIKLDARVTLLAGNKSARHPASCLTLAEVATFTASIAHGFPTNQGYFTLDDVGLTGQQGTLWNTKPTLELRWLPTDEIQVIRAS